ncbi:N-alpha-acetyltransferase 40 isoform X7 [Ricinus communis]|uniref:N-alpha-acetyltransferase 40 isoform X7 n=1 Tax=Ricinus communis TaxID=3988 RepID=UPI00201AEF31|nr:N-alpha-acetyltransferase 40 isoform X7 [Ricinus communis]
MESSALSTTLQDINGSNLSRQRKTKRKEIVEKRKAINELIKAASVENDHLASFPAFRQFDRTGFSVYLESGSGDKLSSSLKRELQKLVKDNMERHYGHEWATEEKVKRREMVTPEARYIFVYEAANNNRKFIENEMILVGFVHYRFTLEEEFPVLYVYEIQLQSRVQGKGLGKFLMQLIECIARKMGVDKNYEILCKAFDSEAEAILQVYQDGSITMAAWQLQTYTRMPADMVPLSWDTTDGF